jgi:serine/threonine-protein kinase
LNKGENVPSPAEGRPPGVEAETPLHPLHPLHERYGRYHLIERIGRGGMAEVFRAVAQGVEGFRRVFVIKRIRPEKSDSAELIRMFCDEARLSALLHHPNIVQVYDFGQIGGTYFLAMEYLRGKDLAAIMRVVRRAKSAIEPSIAAYVAQQVANGLQYAHTLTKMDGQPIRVVHRDVTPSNIMLQRTGAVKVLDFGIAQATNFARQVETGGGRVKGKLAYLSPEQVRLQELDGRSDLFALGVVMWEMLVGQRLVPGENEFVTMKNVLGQPVPAPSSIRAEVPAALDSIVARALERDRDLRYPTAQAMADDLEQFLRQAPCASQAIAHLLQELFGEEATEDTPDIPDLNDAESGQLSRSDAAPAACDGSGEAAVEIEILPPDSPSLSSSSSSSLAPLPPGLPDPSRTRRRVVIAAATATLAGCLLWTVAHNKRWAGRFSGRAVEAITRVFAERPPASPAAPSLAPPPALPPPPPLPSPSPLPSSPPEANAEPAGEADPAAPRVRPAAKRRAARRISNDVTLDPFK